VADDQKTREVNQAPSTADDQATRALADVGIVAELRATLGNGDKKTLPLYAMADTVVVGRGTACDWQIDDDSLSRRHASFKWSGTGTSHPCQLTVEDLGSANGTRVGGRPARSALPVKAGEAVQMGTVTITLELRQQPAAAPRGPDEQSTRLVSSPDVRDEDLPSDPGTPSPLPTASRPLPAQPTVVRPQPPPGAANARAQVFRPERDAARPDESTRSWDPRAVLVRAPEKALDASEIIEQIKAQWRVNRRMFVLAGAAAWVALLLIVWSFFEPKPVEEDPFAGGTLPQVKAPTPSHATPSPTPNAPSPNAPTPNAPTVTQLPTPAPTPLPSNPTAAPATGDDADAMEHAISAYDQGRLADALVEFRALAQKNDATAQFMAQLIEARLAGGGSP
jgi:pSer/pThr/pTyr-binding forkhead associated (FHA) protein